jgi:hypothetical protein
LLVFSFCAFAQPPEIEWSRTYGRSNADDDCSAILPTSDGGYLLCGTTFPNFDPWVWDLFVVKTNSNGDSLWSRIYGTSGWEECLAAQATMDGGFVLAGIALIDTITSGFDFMLMKISSQGDSLWCRNYRRYAHDICYSVLPTSDGGYLLGGVTFDIDTGNGNAWLVKTNANGDSLWSRIYRSDGGSEIRGIQPAEDGGYILAGATVYMNQSSLCFWTMKINDDGDSLWSRTYRDPDYTRCYCIQQTQDDGYILAGKKLCSQPSNDYNFLLLKTNANGDSLWSRSYGDGNTDEICKSVQQTADGGYILVGEALPTDFYNYDGWVVRTDAAGDSLWSMRLSATYHDRLGDVLPAADGGYVLGGHTMDVDSETTYPMDMWLVKLTPEMSVPNAPIPQRICFLSNYPNPFNSTTVLQFTVPRTSRVMIRAFDVLGREVGTIADAVYSTGEYSISWHCPGSASGVYWIRMSGDGFQQVRKTILLR